MIIYLIRHGETDWNQMRKLQGREDTELNETGKRQAHDCGRAFEDIDIDCIVSSPLKRAKMTAEIIAEYTRVPAITIEYDLIERDYGRLSGLTPEERDDFYLKNEDDCMEPKGSLTQRLLSVVDKYVKKNELSRVIMVSHGAAINALLSGISKGEIGSGKIRLKNACISKLRCQADNIEIEYYNKSTDEFRAMKESDK